MNTPELKAGQRFLSRLEADNEITEVTAKQGLKAPLAVVIFRPNTEVSQP